MVSSQINNMATWILSYVLFYEFLLTFQQTTAEILLAANADPNIADHNGETALHIAVKKADCVMTRMLLAKGANPSVVDRHGNAALHTATLYGHLQLIKTLLKYDADVYQRGHQGAIPSHIAAREGHIHLVQVRELISDLKLMKFIKTFG